MTIRIDEKVMQHLAGFRLLHMEVLLLAPRFHEELMDQLAHRPPGVAVLHHKDMITAGNQMGDGGWWTVTVSGASFVEQLLDQLPVGKDDDRTAEALEREDPPIPFCPFGHPILLVCYGT